MKRGGFLKRKTSLQRSPRWTPKAEDSEVIGDCPRVPVRSTTERRDQPSLPKYGRFACRELVDFQKRQRCRASHLGGCAGGIDPHHFPTKGAGGDDLGIIPLCRRHHDEAQRYRVPFLEEWQRYEAAQSLVLFLRTCSSAERLAFVVSWDDYARSRAFNDVTF